MRLPCVASERSREDGVVENADNTRTHADCTQTKPSALAVLRLWYNADMTTAQLKKAENLAEMSKRYAHKSLEKSRELEIYLSILDHKAGRVLEFPSARAITQAAKRMK